jgi:hypothetical protein
MTAQTTQLVTNEIPSGLQGWTTPRYTDLAKPEADVSLLAQTPLRTETANSPRNPLPVTASPAASDQVAVAQGVEGVIAGIRAETILIQCQISDEQVDINLPPALVPAELQSYGQPVLLTLDYSAGYQRPVVERRSPPAHAILPEEAELDVWISQL